MAAIWNPARQQSVRAGFGASDAAAIVARLDGAAGALAAARVDACEDTEARGERTRAQLALRMGCLDRQVLQFGAVIDALAAADRAAVDVGIVDGAPEVIRDLDEPAACDDIERLALAPPEPIDPAIHARLDHLRTRLAAARAAIGLRQERRVLDELHALAGEAGAIGYCPVAVEADYLLAQALARTAGSPDQTAAAAAHLRATALAADACGDDRTRARALIALVEVSDPRDPAAVDRLADEAEAASRRFDQPGLTARLSAIRAGIARRRGEPDAALTLDPAAPR